MPILTAQSHWVRVRRVDPFVPREILPEAVSLSKFRCPDASYRPSIPSPKFRIPFSSTPLRSPNRPFGEFYRGQMNDNRVDTVLNAIIAPEDRPGAGAGG